MVRRLFVQSAATVPIRALPTGLRVLCVLRWVIV